VSDLLDSFLAQVAHDIARRVLAELQPGIGAEANAAASSAEPPAAYDTEDAARLLGLSVRETKRRIASGELHSVKLGRRRLIPRQAVSDFLAGRPTGAERDRGNQSGAERDGGG
jgi:excisionase family DNA binding protein